jgi:carbon storage regulator
MANGQAAAASGGPLLVLTRKTNESIMIGDSIEVSILSVSGDKVRVGIAAPREIGVFRKEVYVTIDGDGARRDGASADGADVHPAEPAQS